MKITVVNLIATGLVAIGALIVLLNWGILLRKLRGRMRDTGKRQSMIFFAAPILAVLAARASDFAAAEAWLPVYCFWGVALADPAQYFLAYDWLRRRFASRQS
jgi:hypothetical protein